MIERMRGGDWAGHGGLAACLPFSSQSAPRVRLGLGPMPLRFDERQAAAYTACSNAIRVSNTCSSLAGRICIIMTAAIFASRAPWPKLFWRMCLPRGFQRAGE